MFGGQGLGAGSPVDSLIKGWVDKVWGKGSGKPGGQVRNGVHH